MPIYGDYAMEDIELLVSYLGYEKRCIYLSFCFIIVFCISQSKLV